MGGTGREAGDGRRVQATTVKKETIEIIKERYRDIFVFSSSFLLNHAIVFEKRHLHY